MGGGIRSLDDAAAVLDCGADKVAMNSAAIADPELITRVAERYGSQAVVVAIDARQRTPTAWEVYVWGGRKPTGVDAQEWAMQAEQLGAGEILLTSMDRDGTKSGFDCPLTRTIATSVRIPVIASGGAGEPHHFVEVFEEGAADAALAASVFHFGSEVGGDDQAGAARCRHPGEAGVLIPSIDLMGGKIVQLVQGEKKALEFANFAEWVERFAKYPLVQLIDLDAAMGKGDNRSADRGVLRQAAVPGGRRHSHRRECADACWTAGAKRVILGSSLVRDGAVDANFAAAMSGEFGAERLVAAIDSRGGRVAIHGWKTITDITPAEMIAALEPYCSAFLYTHIDTEGMLQGIPMDVVRELEGQTSRKLIAAGGFAARQEIDELDAMGVDAVVGMAIYTGNDRKV